ncbi:MAG: flagellar motor protein MotB [Proteobacteria bacterium]|nr:flagellar motor protein MotB [Pseudomonadota bacterium]
MALESEKTKRKTTEDEEESSWIVTYADMMTLLLCLFVMLFAISKTEDHKLKALADAFRLLPWTGSPFIHEGSDSVLALNRIAKNDKSIDYDRNKYIISFSGLSLFRPGSARLKADAIEKVNRISRILVQIPNTIIIEGHTDNTPIESKRYPSNWDLSAARAAAVARKLKEFGIVEERMEVRAFASTRPKVANDSDEGKRKNRRIEILINF